MLHPIFVDCEGSGQRGNLFHDGLAMCPTCNFFVAAEDAVCAPHVRDDILDRLARVDFDSGGVL